MSDRKKYSYGTMFLFLFINLFSGLAEGGENINMASHIGGFIGGFCFSVILNYKMNYRMQFWNKNMRKIYFFSIATLIIFPIASIVSLALQEVKNIADYVCFPQK